MSVHSRIAYYILTLLHLNGTVRIPGLGRVVRERKKAVIDDVTGTVHPPQIHSSFFEDRSTRGRLLEKYLSYKTSMSRSLARKEIVRFSTGVDAAIREHGRAEIDYIGTISKSDDSLRLEPNEILLHPGHAVLPTIALPPPLFPQPDFPEGPGVARAEQRTILSDDETKPAPTVPATAFATPTRSVAATDDAVQEQIPEISPVLIAPAGVSSKARSSRDTRRVNRDEIHWLVPTIAMILVFVAFGYVLFKFLTPDRDPVVQEVTATLPVQRPDTGDRLQEADITDGTLTDEDRIRTVQEDNAGAGQHQESEVAEPLSGQTGVPAVAEQEPTDKCLIVVGAFSQSANATRMVQRLEALGYGALTLEHGRLTQVGVPVACESAVLAAHVAELRTKVEPGAWVLHNK